jgi:hypothetical protein
MRWGAVMLPIFFVPIFNSQGSLLKDVSKGRIDINYLQMAFQ